MSITDMLKDGAEAAKEFAEDVADKAEDLAEQAGDAIKKALGDRQHLQRAQEMYKMIGEGKMLDAFEKYYHDDVVMIEATGDVREGKATSRAFEEQFLSTIQEVHGGGTPVITSNEEAGITMVETWMDVTFKDGNRVKMEEVAVQHWKDGLIVRERFYYNAPS